MNTDDFNGTNYLECPQSAKITLAGEIKLVYVSEKIKPLPENDSTYRYWKAEVMSWLLQSMEPSISRTFVFSKSTKYIWDGAMHNL